MSAASGGSGADRGSGTDRGSGDQSRPPGIRGLVARILGLGPIRHLLAVLDAYGDAGGGLLAAGLAFGAVFSLIPITLLVVAISGFFVADPNVRTAVIQEIEARVPPLEPFVSTALNQLSEGTAGLGILALIGLAWTSSQFYGQLDSAFALIFRGERQRSIVAKTARGLVTLVVAVALFTVLLVVSTLATHDVPILSSVAVLVKVGSPILALIVVLAAITLVYRLVPTRRIPWRAALVPAVVVSIVEIAMSTLFVVLAPHLASPRIFGPFVTIFASLAWLSWSFQVLLIGAAWVRERAFGVESILVTHAEADGADAAAAGGDAGASGN